MAGAGVFIGIGGIGGSIVAAVRQALELRVRAAGDNPATAAAGDQFRFLLLDTWRDAAAQGFSPSETVQLPSGPGMYGVDERIEKLYYQDDPAFRKWWPEDRHGSPLRVGNFSAGAGQLRVKGKLAYRIHLTSTDVQAVSVVENALYRINDILGPGQGMRTIPVYIVCSLGGGTGSGMALAFAQHLRERLEDNSPIIGVFPLASVTCLGPGSADGSSVYANTDAALREIDYMQRMSGRQENRLEPFFEWPGAGNRIVARQRPFTYCYLFGRENANGLNFTTFDQYVQQIAECLIAETFSELVGASTFDVAISGPHSQFVQHLQARPEMLGQPTTYASAAVGAVRYPSERIARHLARRYANRVIGRMVQHDATAARAAAQAFALEHAIDWAGAPSFEDQFDEPTRLGTDQSEPVPALPPLNTPAFQEARMEDTVRLARDSRTKIEGFIGTQYSRHVEIRRQEIVDQYTGPNGYLQLFAIEMLERGGASGLGFALEAMRSVRAELQRQSAAAIVRVNGDAGGDEPGLLLAHKDANDEDAWEGAINRLRSGFGFMKHNGRDAKAAFVKQRWSLLANTWMELKRAQAGMAAYSVLEAEAGRIEQALSSLAEQADQTRAGLQSMVRSDLGQEGYGGSLDVAVLDDPDLVGHHFAGLLERVVGSSSEATANTIVNSDDGVRGALQTRLGARRGVAQLDDDFRGMLERRAVGDGLDLVAESVDKLSIWEALAAECDARQALDLIDRVLSDALADTRRKQQLATQGGVARDDWSDELLRAFIRGKLQECQARVRPFWRLDSIRSASHGEPYRFTVVARDKRVYEDARNVLGLGDVLDETSQMMGAGRPYELPGRHAIVLYSREGVAPLCYLDNAELAEMRKDAAQVSGYKFLYTDLRFRGAVDPVIAPGESFESRLRYLLGSALHLGLLQRPSENGHVNGAVALDGSTFDSLREMYRSAKSDPGMSKRVTDLVNDFLGEFDDSRRSSLIKEARMKARDNLRHARNLADEQEIAFWEETERALSNRIETDQYLVHD